MAGSTGFSGQRRIGAAKLHEFQVIEKFNLGYRNREDITNLPPGVMVTGSQNVLTNTSGRIAVRKGYALDGQSNSTVGTNIQSSFDWYTFKGGQRNMRAGFLSSAGVGKMQYRYVASAGDYYNGTTFTEGQVYWIDLLSSLTSVSFNFTIYWNTTEAIATILFCNGGQNVWEWTGAITTLLSATSNTITKTGTDSWQAAGFYLNGTRQVTINGNTYTYTGGETTTTLTGVTGDPSAESVNSIIQQTPRSTASSAVTGLPATFNISLISNLRNQVYYGSLSDFTVYISKIDNYQDVSFTSPVRVVGEGALATLNDALVAFYPQQDAMYVSAGRSQWYQTSFTLSSDLAKESFQIVRLKTTEQQGAQSQALVTKIKNNIVSLSFEPIINSLGLVANVLDYPQMTDLSYSIVNDMNALDFTGGSLFYYRNFLYVAVPSEGLVLIYNMTNPKDIYWEAPQILPISRFSIIDGNLYGHSSQVGETYELFTGYNDNGNPIAAVALFSFQNYGVRNKSKSFNKFYSEGYISSNTTLTLGLQYDLDGCAINTQYDLLGSNSEFVCVATSDASLGKVSLGKNPLGGQLGQTSATSLPPKFRWIKTFGRTPNFEFQPSYSSTGIDQQWEILAFGPAESATSEGENYITD